MKSVYYFVENMTLRTWFLSVWPRLVWRRFRSGPKVVRCHVIEGSRLSMFLARATARLSGVPVERFTFEFVEARDPAGVSVRLRIIYGDLARAQQYALDDQDYRVLSSKVGLEGRLPMYLAKGIASTDHADRSTVHRALSVIQACVWKMRSEGEPGHPPVLFMEKRPWLAAIDRYAREEGVTVVPVTPASNIRGMVRGRLPIWAIDMVRHSRDWLRIQRLKRGTAKGTGEPAFQGRDGHRAAAGSGPVQRREGPRVAVDYYGQLNLDHPERHSDFSFWQQSALEGSDLLVAFSIPRDPLDLQKLAELEGHGMEAVVLNPAATTLPAGPIFKPRRRRNKPARGLTGPQGVWIKEQTRKYQRMKAFWTDLAESRNIKVYVTWFKYDATHCAIADGLQAAGGVIGIYQRAYEVQPSVEATIGADIVFGFSPAVADIESRSDSVIRYHVAVGYLGDHRFPLLREQAQTVRKAIQQRGARHILAFFDENSSEGTRWLAGHHLVQKNYAFVLGKVLENPWLGLVIKPKAPGTLRRRLGPVAELLERAEATGRCYVYQSGVLQGSHPPAAAALCADLAVHCHLYAATAGMEAALAGVPTLVLDRDGWGESPLYRLGAGRVVFNDWAELWDACVQHWESPEGFPGLGDWSPFLDEIDPFRDGRAAERMGTYIKWLIEGFRDGHDRDAAMAGAAERYTSIWGADKITEVNGAMRGAGRRLKQEELPPERVSNS